MKLPCTVNEALCLTVEEEDYVWRCVSRQPEALHDCRVVMQLAQIRRATSPRKATVGYWPGFHAGASDAGEP